MSAELKETIGYMAGLISLLAYVPYILSIVRGYTKPSRATWFILMLVTYVTLFTYGFSGASNTLWISIGDTIGVTITAFLCIKYGHGGKSRLDIVCLLGAIIALMLWAVTNSPLVGLVAILMVDFTALIPTIVKTWEHPHHEDAWGWGLTSLGGFVGIFSIERLAFGIIVYPVYQTLGNGVVFILSLLKPSD